MDENHAHGRSHGLKETEFVNFTGTVTYRTTVEVNDPTDKVLNLGRVWGVAEVKVNDQELGVRWYGDQTYDVPPA